MAFLSRFVGVERLLHGEELGIFPMSMHVGRMQLETQLVDISMERLHLKVIEKLSDGYCTMNSILSDIKGRLNQVNSVNTDLLADHYIVL